MNSQLVRCPTCKRHIYRSEAACPFCVRQGNATPAILAAALSAGLAVAGCGSATPESRPPVEIAPSPDGPDPNQPKEIAEDPKQKQTDPIMNPAPAYGGPPPVVPGPVTPPAAAYGAPPPMTPSPKP